LRRVDRQLRGELGDLAIGGGGERLRLVERGDAGVGEPERPEALAGEAEGVPGAGGAGGDPVDDRPGARLELAPRLCGEPRRRGRGPTRAGWRTGASTAEARRRPRHSAPPWWRTRPRPLASACACTPPPGPSRPPSATPAPAASEAPARRTRSPWRRPGPARR